MKLTDQQLEQFNRDGYLFIPNLFSPAEVTALKADLPRIFSLQRDEILRSDDGEVRGALGMQDYSEVFRRLLCHPRLVQPAHQILGGDVYCHQYKIIGKDPFGKLDFPWHQDYASWHANDGMPEPRAMNYAVFLDDVTEFNGPITLIPGSHRRGELESEAEILPAITALWTMNRETIEKLVAKNGMVAPKGPPGSGLFFHSCMAHASGPNLSPWTRYLVYLTCNRTDNYIRTPTRPTWYANQDFTPIEMLSDDCLLDIVEQRPAAE